jgi:hypothetical protein
MLKRIETRCLMAGLLALCATQATAQAPLKLPSSQGEIRALLRETNDPICVRCGVVTSARTVSQAGSGVSLQHAPGPLPGGGDMDTEIGAVPFGTEGGRHLREAQRKGAAPRYEVVVRYDDGSYGRVEMANDPRLKRGDRVQVEDGTVRRYP